MHSIINVYDRNHRTMEVYVSQLDKNNSLLKDKKYFSYDNNIFFKNNFTIRILQR